MPENRSSFRLCGPRFLSARGPRALLRRQDGNAAVEFALVAAPFFALLIAILETALVFMKEAERHDPHQAISVLSLLQALGRVDESASYADRVFTIAHSPGANGLLVG